MPVIADYLVRLAEAQRALGFSQDDDVRALIDRLKLRPCRSHFGRMEEMMSEWLGSVVEVTCFSCRIRYAYAAAAISRRPADTRVAQARHSRINSPAGQSGQALVERTPLLACASVGQPPRSRP